MYDKIIIYPENIEFLFGEGHKEIEINLGEIKGFFWGEGISKVTAIVGKNGSGKSTILRYFKSVEERKKNIIYYSPHFELADDFNFGVDKLDISIDSITRRDLERIDDKETNENGRKYHPKQDLLFLRTKRQIDFMSSEICRNNSVFSKIFEKLDFNKGRVYLRGLANINEKTLDEIYWNTPGQFRGVIKGILNKCEDESRKWTDIRRFDENYNHINQNRINAYFFKRKLIISFLSIVLDLFEKDNLYLEEGIFEVNIENDDALTSLMKFTEHAKVSFRKNKDDAQKVFNGDSVKTLFRTIHSIVDEIENEEEISKSSFVTSYDNIKNIIELQDNIINELEKYYLNKKFVQPFLGVKSTERVLSSGENALLNLFSHLYELVKSLEEDEIKDDYTVLLDEADLAFHPSWKKKFVNAILKSIPQFFKFNGKQSTVQIIFTTHDPLTLSDMPSQNVIFLDKDAENKTIISTESKETFGANISDLLEDSFFLEDGLIGDFAKEKIHETIEWLNNPKRNKEKSFYFKQIIELLDEPILQTKLAEMFDEKMNPEDKTMSRRLIQKQISHLKDKLEDL